VGDSEGVADWATTDVDHIPSEDGRIVADLCFSRGLTVWDIGNSNRWFGKCEASVLVPALL
jgi:hypothetical protein